MSNEKTELCKFEQFGKCKRGTICAFAHSREELEKKDTTRYYKTRLCKSFWTKMSCPYGVRCCFIHTLKRTNSITFAFLLSCGYILKRDSSRYSY